MSNFNAILGEIKAPSVIFNTVTDVYILASVIRNLKFLYYDRYVNTLTDFLAKKAHQCNVQTISIIKNI